MEINNLGSQAPALPSNVQDQAVNSTNTQLGQEVQQLETAAETAFASVFFSLLQNILSEAQNNSSA